MPSPPTGAILVLARSAAAAAVVRDSLVRGGVAPDAITVVEGAWLDDDALVAVEPGADEIVGLSAAARELSFARTAARHVRDAMLVADTRPPPDGPTVHWANPAWTELTGAATSRVVGQQLLDLPGLAEISGEILGRIRSGRSLRTEIAGVDAAGEPFIGELRMGAPFGTPDRSYVVIAIRDVSRRKRLERHLEHLAHHDALTGLPNRRLFHDRLSQALERARRFRGHVAVLFLDLDEFKPVNDNLGHAVGDQVLGILGTRMRAAVRASDTVARLGGDEFGLLLSDLTHPADAEIVANKLVAAIKQPVRLTGVEQPLRVSASVGICVHPTDGSSAGELLRRADTAMYRAKRTGPGTVLFWSKSRPTGDSQPSADLHLPAPEFAAIRSPATGRLVGVQLSPLSAEDPPAATATVGHFTWMLSLERAIAEVLASDLIVSFTLQEAQLQLSDLAEQILRLLDEGGMPVQRVQLGVREAHLSRHFSDGWQRLEDLHAVGIRTAIESFGTGYTAPAQLQRAAVDVVVLDRSLLVGSRRLASGVAALLDHLGLELWAARVATAEQAARAAELGCVAIQGPWIGLPGLFADVSPPG